MDRYQAFDGLQWAISFVVSSLEDISHNFQTGVLVKTSLQVKKKTATEITTLQGAR